MLGFRGSRLKQVPYFIFIHFMRSPLPYETGSELKTDQQYGGSLSELSFRDEHCVTFRYLFLISRTEYRGLRKLQEHLLLDEPSGTRPYRYYQEIQINQEIQIIWYMGRDAIYRPKLNRSISGKLDWLPRSPSFKISWKSMSLVDSDGTRQLLRNFHGYYYHNGN